VSCTKRIASILAAALLTVVSVPAEAHAQRGRHHGGGRTVVVAPYYYAPYYNPFYWGFGWGYPGFYPPPAYGYAIDEGTARLQVTPRETEVYVDGYRVGIVDDFDGMSQRLRLPPGDHVIELYLDGHRMVTQNVMFTRGQTLRIRHTMEALAPGESQPVRPAPRTVAPSAPAAPVAPAQMYDALGRPIAGTAAPAAQTSGTIAIRVQPGDAVILVDGERWQGSSGERLDVQVSPGSHRIEVQKEGYQPFSSSVQVRPGETSTVNVSLTRSGGDR